MKQLHINDTFDFAPSSRTKDANGFLHVTGRAARTGVYQYLASELGLTDRAPNDIVNVYRPAEEVFNDSSLKSYANVDVTNDHPNTMVDAKTYKATSVGHVISASQSGDFVDVSMIIKDERAIQDVESGKAQLSPGYTAVYVEEKSTAPCGTAYDFKQTGIDVNHVAIVKRGRGGDQVRINDNHGVKTMNKVTLDAGRSIEIEDAAVAALVTDSIARLTQQVADADAKVEQAEATRDAMQEKLTVAESLTSDEAIAKRVADIATVQTQARKVAGDDFTCDSVDSTTIQRAALLKVRDCIAWDDKSEAYVQAAFDMALADADATPAHKPNEQHTALAHDAAHEHNQAPKLSAYDARKQELQNAWKGK